MVEELITKELIIDKDNITIFDKSINYKIPRYQRAYAWEDKEIEQLIDDIYDNESNNYYYIGTLVVSKVKNFENTFEVIDGQQRLTTLFLLLQYLFYEKKLNNKIEQTLSFDCRDNSNYTLHNIQKVLAEYNNKTNKYDNNYDDNKIEQSMINGIKIIRQKFKNNNIDIDKFFSLLRKVILYRIEVPENTDLNRYFEIMNTRGEQLEQHDILKARLMGYLNDNIKEQEFFSRIWDACSDMTGYVQMHLSIAERKVIFGNEWNTYPYKEECKQYSLDTKKEEDNHRTIEEIIGNDFKVNNIDGETEDGSHTRFESIIDFPYFLLHALRVFVKLNNISNDLGDLLDDKKLIKDFENIINKEENIEDKKSFSKKFIIHLLQTRYLFDKYIIKREYIGDDKDGEWSLKELYTTGQGSKKKAYYANTKLKYHDEREKTYISRNKECLMIQSALRVSYTSPKVMHWITDILVWLFENKDCYIPKLTNKAEDIAAIATYENFLKLKNYKLGVNTPHIVFNFLDYILWKEGRKDGNKYSNLEFNNFEFEFRNSVEHWYPQNPSEGSFNQWDDKDTFGNLCIISRSINSKFSNLSPESKMKSYSKTIMKGSLKLRIMGNNIKNEEWIKEDCKNHEEEMLNMLNQYIEDNFKDKRECKTKCVK